jgi:ABC-2 type transport system permease protein
MNKIILIASREFLTRVKKKSFLIMTLLGPLLISGFYGAIIYISVNDSLSNDTKNILVLDGSGIFNGKLRDNDFYKFIYDSALELEAARLKLRHEDFFALLRIPAGASDSLEGFELIGTTQPSVRDQSYIESQMEQVLQAELFAQKGIDRNVINDISSTEIHLKSSKDTGDALEAGNAGAATAVGFFSAFLIYIFIFLYGVQIMRGVLEEKTNRIAEVIISSVKPFELMMGKISGLAMVALLQFVVWIALTALLSSVVTTSLVDYIGIADDAKGAIQNARSGEFGDVLGGFTALNVPLVSGMFLFYFLAGYLFYGALFAAIGSAVDNETDTQQFMFPITMPLIFAIVMSQSAVVTNPHGSMAFWLSVIPFTSPIAMMVRIPFGIEGMEWQVILSVICMMVGIVFNTWIAGRIYRTGILMYGKKASWRELGKWLFYKG